MNNKIVIHLFYIYFFEHLALWLCVNVAWSSLIVDLCKYLWIFLRFCLIFVGFHSFFKHDYGRTFYMLLTIKKHLKNLPNIAVSARLLEKSLKFPTTCLETQCYNAIKSAASYPKEISYILWLLIKWDKSKVFKRSYEDHHGLASYCQWFFITEQFPLRFASDNVIWSKNLYHWFSLLLTGEIEKNCSFITHMFSMFRLDQVEAGGWGLNPPLHLSYPFCFPGYAGIWRQKKDSGPGTLIWNKAFQPFFF